ncbi:hypothetical protein GCM10020358_77460 [Amorphoplanes nipponensis]
MPHGGGAGASGVLALAFPLHPPGRPERSRAAELPARIPTLVVNGDRDPSACRRRAAPWRWSYARARSMICAATCPARRRQSSPGCGRTDGPGEAECRPARRRCTTRKAVRRKGYPKVQAGTGFAERGGLEARKVRQLLYAPEWPAAVPAPVPSSVSVRHTGGF